ncbi:hypothetical protein AC1031_022079 [Aphanomyces cochlioides]|nr:hypothetical protein AC1031_022079 [Aphanomyces cochlioides]
MMSRIIFEHVTDRLTLVRWSLLNYCSVKADGPLSLHELARSLHYPNNTIDSDEFIVERIRHASVLALAKIRDEFCEQSDRFKLESSSMGSCDELFVKSE